MKGKTNSRKSPYLGHRLLSALPMRSQASSVSSQHFSFLNDKTGIKFVWTYWDASNLRGGNTCEDLGRSPSRRVKCSVDVYGNDHTKSHRLLHSEVQQEPPISSLEFVLFLFVPSDDFDCPSLPLSLSLSPHLPCQS